MNINKIFKSESFLNQCRKFKLKITPQRIVIYKAVSRSHHHPDSTEIYKIVKKEFPSITFDTVHRTLLTFSEFNLIAAVEGSDNSKRFDPNIVNHHHLICEECGTIIDFQREEFDKLKVPDTMLHDFHVTRKRVIIAGICKACQKKNKSK